MKKYYHLLLVFLFAAPVYAQTIQRLDGNKLTAAELSDKVKELMAKAKVSGLGLTVFNHHKVVYQQTFGLADVPLQKKLTSDQVMYGASFSKAVFAYIVGQLVAEKVIDLDKPLVSYLNKPLPDYQIRGWNRGYQQLKDDKRYELITARMCMTHTTGFPNWRWFEPDKKLKFLFDPGQRYNYSGEGMYLLQFVIEQITGKGYEQLAQERVFKPLEMTNTSYVWQDRFKNNLVYGHNKYGQRYELMEWKEASCAGSMSTTVADYSKFFLALMRSKQLPLIMQPSVRIRSVKQFGPLSRVDSTTNDNIQLSYGLGLGLLNTPYKWAFFKEGHDEGWGHYSIGWPSNGIGIVILTNSDTGESIFKELLSYAIGDTFTPWEWEDYLPQ